jgi:hypothetical protein
MSIQKTNGAKNPSGNCAFKQGSHFLALKTTAFWDTAPCGLAEVDRCLKGAWRQYRPLKLLSTSMRLHDAIFQKAVTSILAAMRI